MEHVAIILLVTGTIILTLGKVSVLYMFQSHQDYSNYKACVINLARRRDRIIAFRKHYTLPIKYDIMDAVDGQTLDANRLIDQGVLGDAGMKSLLDSKNGISKRYHYELGSIGAIGCSLSHIKIWRKVLQENTKYMMVFEDDARVTGISMDDIILRLEDLPEDWHIYMIGQPHSILEGIHVPSKNQLYKLTRFCGTHAYIINSTGARYLIERGNLFPIQQQIDSYLSELGWDYGMNIYMHLNKPMFGTFDRSSDIQVQSDKSTWKRFRLT